MYSKDASYLQELMCLRTGCVTPRLMYDVVSSNRPALLTPLS
jgi:hypothetical protein